MRLDDVPSVDFVGADAAVVRPLRPGEAALGPAEGMAVDVEQRVFLLDTEPRVLISRQVHQFLAFVTIVGALRLAPARARGGCVGGGGRKGKMTMNNTFFSQSILVRSSLVLREAT